jgi:hypothetical protein
VVLYLCIRGESGGSESAWSCEVRRGWKSIYDICLEYLLTSSDS